MDEARALGIEASLHMEMDVDAGTKRRRPPVTAAIASCRPESTDFRAALDRIAAAPFVHGLRRILHTSSDELGLTPLFAENPQRLAEHNLSFDFRVLAWQLPIAVQLAPACSGVRFVMNHCGVPDITGQGLDPWRDGNTEMAALPNVACKISGVVAYAGADWTAADLRRYVQHCIEPFGWGRVVWCSDWPVCTLTADLTRWVRATHELSSGCSESERERLLSLNARRIYRLDAGAEAAGP